MGFGKTSAYDRSFKLAALERLAAGEGVSDVARALGIRRELLCEWRKDSRAGGIAALRGRGRPSAAAKAALVRSSVDSPSSLPPPDELALARQRIEALERKIGRQALELDFFAAALQLTEQVDRAAPAWGCGDPTAPHGGSRGEPASTTSSKVGRSGKAG